MIKTREDFLRYLEADRVALGRQHKYGFIDWLMDPVWTYERLMRKLEYYETLPQNPFRRFWKKLTYFRYHRISVMCGLTVPAGVFGEGLSIAHYGAIVVSTLAKIGKNCRIHVGVNIGVGSDGKVPVIGDNCYLGPGAKLFGGIVLGDNVKVGANAVVTKSFPEGNCTLVGIPARKLEK